MMDLFEFAEQKAVPPTLSNTARSDAFLAGHRAGLTERKSIEASGTCLLKANPYTPCTSAAGQDWMDGWAEGRGGIFENFGK